MKRKINQVGTGTYTISLPMAWVKENGLDKGQEIELIQQGRELIICTQMKVESKKIEINIVNLKGRVIRWILSALHKFGYDEIKLIYGNDKKILYIVNDVIKNLFLGFVIIEQTDNYLALKNVSEEKPEEFEASLRRAFLVTLSMSESVLDMIKKKEFQSLKNLVTLENSNNQLTNLCERILNKWKYKETQKTNLFYVIAWNLEKVCDNYKYICDFLSDAKNIKISKKIIDLFEETNKILRHFYEIFYNFNSAKLNDFVNNKKKTESEIQEYISSANKHEAIVLLYLKTTIMNITDFCASTFAINYSKE